MRSIVLNNLIVLGVLLVAIFSMGCSDEDNPVEHDPDLVGVWEKIQTVCNGVSEDFDQMTLTLDSDGSGTMIDGLVVYNVTWWTSDNKVMFRVVGEDEVHTHTYSIDNDIFRASRTEDDGVYCQYTFSRVTD